MPVNPWYTGTLDLAIVVSLVRWRPKESLFAIRRAVAVLVIWLLIGVPFAFAMDGYNPTTLSDVGEIIGNGRIVVLEPEKWIGKRFPLLPYIKGVPVTSKPGERPLRERLAEGDWIVVLYHHDCPSCRERMPVYCKRASLDATAPQLALIEVPPYDDLGTLPLLLHGKCSSGRLGGPIEWLVETPAEIAIHGALVIAATKGVTPRLVTE